MKGPLISYTDKLYDILVEIINDPIAEILIKIEGDYLIDNHLDIEKVEVSDKDWFFNVYILGEYHPIKCAKYIRYVLPGVFTDKEIYNFTQKYNNAKNKISKTKKLNYKKVELSKFVYNPKDIRSTFLSLTSKTYPHGHEEEVMQFMPKDLQKDQFGNYYKIIGKSETMFTSHLDTADRKQLPVEVYSVEDNGDEIFITDGKSILGADDKSGVAVMLYMIAHNIPGIYYFFIGEERGGIGSNKLASIYETVTHLKNVKRCISFDRRNYYSVITNQLGRTCCSDKFASELAKELNKSGLKLSLDTTGIYTDSASFIDDIAECTNISVGYFNEHTTSERQNISYLERLAKACLKVNWEDLPTIRKVGFDEQIIIKYRKFIADFKSSIFSLETKLVGSDGDVFIKIELDDPDIEVVHSDILSLSILLNKHKMDPDIYFEDQYIKIKLD
jgi:hypothetical protein